MKVLNIASNDYANMSHNNARALRSVNVECDDYVLNFHPFEYESQSNIIDKKRLLEICNDYDIVQIFHSCEIIFNLIIQADFKGRIVVYHTGTRYRERPSYFNKLFKGVDVIMTDQTEFMELGAKNIHYIAPHVELLPTEKRKQGKLIIGHYPSNHDVKGTNEIIKMLEPFKNDFEIRIDITKLPHKENLQRISECHIYIELFKPELKGKTYGCFGVTAFEASALGCLVVTNNLHQNVYNDVYNNCPFYIENTKESFVQLIETIRDVVNHDNFDEIATECHDDLMLSHSIQATGKRILDLIG